eukprot:TRINITY_DN214_c1_g1_i1.p1 TRINITY_DN214_c1_g1~~TRINITY_DN214_c1_g1_i1.p1  ORF type:complete len:954 (+),score=309.35 TRINITY_DN214_c1_g1_i1:68-2863(+)
MATLPSVSSPRGASPRRRRVPEPPLRYRVPAPPPGRRSPPRQREPPRPRRPIPGSRPPPSELAIAAAAVAGAGTGFAALTCDTWRALGDAATAAAAAAPPRSAESLEYERDRYEGSSDCAAHHVQVKLWMDGFAGELSEFRSPSTCAEVVLNRVLAATAGLPQPHRLRTAACFQLTERVSPLLGRYTPWVDHLCRELHRAIFLARPIPAGRSSLARLKATPAAERRQSHITYFEAFEELAERCKSVEFKASTMEEQMEQRARVLQRAIRAWQATFLRRVLKDWRALSQRSRQLRLKYRQIFLQNLGRGRMQAAWRNWEVYCDKMRLREAADTVCSTTKATRQIRSNIDVTLKELGNMLQRINDVEEETAEQRNRHGQLLLEMKAAQDRLQRQRTQLEHIKFVAESFISALIRNPDEFEARQRHAHLLGEPPPVNADFLVRWANSLIKKTSFAKEGAIGDIFALARGVKPFVYLLRGVAPALCSEGWVVRVNAEVDPGKRAAIVLDKCGEMQVSTYVTVDDVVSGRPEMVHALLAHIFRRFADTRPLGMQRTPIWTEGCGQRGDGSSLPTGPARSVEQLRDRWMYVQGANAAWEKRSADAVAEATAVVTEAARDYIERQPLTARQEQERVLYAGAPLAAVAELLPGQNSKQSAYDELVRALHDRCDLLKRVFKFYCSSGDIQKAGTSSLPRQRSTGKDGPASHTTMSRAELTRFATDCKLLGKGRMQRTALDRIFTKILGARQGAEDGIDADAELSANEFTAALCHLAMNFAPKHLSVPDRVVRFLDREIEPRACGSVVDHFKELTCRPGIRTCLRKYGAELTKIFVHYACQNKDLGRDDSTMDLGEWKTFVRGANLLDSLLKERDAQAIIFRLQDEEEGGGELTLSYTQFCEAVVALTFYKVPCPFEPLPQRVSTFVLRLVANLRGQVRGL